MKILEKNRYSDRTIDVFGTYWAKEVLEEVSKIKKGTQITVGYYENGQLEYILNFENKEMILGYTLGKNGKIKEMRKGSCNNLDDYIYVENSDYVFGKRKKCINLDFTKK